MALHLGPNFLMKIQGYPLLLQSMGLESDAQPPFATLLIRAQEFYVAKSLLAGNGRASRV